MSTGGGTGRRTPAWSRRWFERETTAAAALDQVSAGVALAEWGSSARRSEDHRKDLFAACLAEEAGGDREGPAGIRVVVDEQDGA